MLNQAVPAPLYLRPRWCGPDKNCTAPLLSIIKTADGAAGSDTDILIPQFLFLAKSTYHYPWHLKKDVGEHLNVNGAGEQCAIH